MRCVGFVVLAGALVLVSADRAFATPAEGSLNCAGCHTKAAPTTLSVSGKNELLTPPGQGALKAVRVQPGGTATLSADLGAVSSGTFYVLTKGYSDPGLMSAGALGASNTNGWTQRTAAEGVYYTDSASSHGTPAAAKTYNFNVSVPVSTKPDYYRLGYQAAGRNSSGKWSTEEPFYLAVFDAGDTDDNGKVDIFDVAAMQVKYGTTSGAKWADGDFDGNGTVDIFDVALMQTNYGKGVSSTATVVPEPSTLVLAGVGLAALAGLAWRRKR